MLMVVIGEFIRRVLVVVRLPGMLGIVVTMGVGFVALMVMGMAVLVQVLMVVGMGVGMAVADLAMPMFMRMHVAMFMAVGMLVAVAVRAVMGIVHGNSGRSVCAKLSPTGARLPESPGGGSAPPGRRHHGR